MSSTTVVSIDQTVGFKNQVHCTEYLVNGELKTWKGNTSEVYSTIYTENEQGEPGPTLLGSIPDMETEVALDALNAGE